jgi:hypothetical protein
MPATLPQITNRYISLPRFCHVDPTDLDNIEYEGRTIYVWGGGIMIAFIPFGIGIECSILIF